MTASIVDDRGVSHELCFRHVATLHHIDVRQIESGDCLRNLLDEYWLLQCFVDSPNAQAKSIQSHEDLLSCLGTALVGFKQH
jgi:hypothetical protein